MANTARRVGVDTSDQKCKAFVDFTGTGTITINDSFNVASIVDNGTADYSINWDVDFAGTGYCVPLIIQGNGADDVIINEDFSNAKTAGTIRMRTRVEDGSFVDVSSVYAMAFGEQ